MNFLQFAQRRSAAILFIALVASVLGVWSYFVTPASIVPEMTFARVDVVADAGTLPPEQVRTAVTLPLQRVLLGVQSVVRVRGTSAQGSSELIVTFAQGTNTQLDLQRAQAALDQARSILPPGTNVSARIVLPTSESIVSYGVTSTALSPTLLGEMLRYQVAPQLYGIPGMASVLIVGAPQREFRIDINPAALDAQGLRISDVEAAIADATRVQSAGVTQQYAHRSVLLVDSGITSASALARILVPVKGGAVAVGTLGTVRLGIAPRTTGAGLNGKTAVILNIYAAPGADTVSIAREVQRRMKRIEAHLPVGTHVVRYWNQTAAIVASQTSLRDAIAIGALLAVGVILLFLRNVRMTLVAALVIPVAMAISVLCLHLFGQTLNVMSVGGLAVAVGLIIDDAIVVVENIARNLHRYPEMGRKDIVLLSMRELVAPMTASTLTTVVVFVPLALLTGVAGFFFRALAVTLGSALLVSLALAILLTPILATVLLPDARKAHDDEGFIARVLSHYDAVVRGALARRKLVYIGALGILALTAVMLTHLPSEFLPALDEGEFEIAYQLPVGTSLAASDAAAITMEQLVKRNLAVAAVGRQTGVDTNGFSPTQPRQGILRITLVPRSQRASYDDLANTMRKELAVAVPGAQVTFHQILEDLIDDVSGAPAPIEIIVQGDDEATLTRSAERITAAIAKIPGIADANSGIVADDPSIRVAPSAMALSRLGLSSSDVIDSLSASTQGTLAANVPGAQALVGVRVAYAGAGHGNGANRQITTPAGVLPLTVLARLSPAKLNNDLVDENGTRVVLVTASLGSGSLSSVIAALQKTLPRLGLPPTITYRIGGAYHLQQRSFAEFARVIVLAVVLVFVVMLVSFGSPVRPLVILVTIPLALVGVALGLFVTHTALNVSSIMGLLLLVGIVVKNGILLLDVAQRRLDDGDSVEEALVIAGRTRLRPIVMTALAAIGGLLPLAIGIGEGSVLERPLAIAVIGGLSTATIFTLIVIPVLFAGIAGRKPRRS